MRKFVDIELVVMIVGFLVLAGMVFAHPGGVSQKDGCHNDNAVGERHFHTEGTAERAGLCETRDGIHYRIVQAEPEIREIEVIKEVTVLQKTPNVQAMEDSHKRIVAEYGRLADQLRELANRPLPAPQVVEIEKEVPGLKPTSAQCLAFRVQVEQSLGWSVSTAEQAALDAIGAGCF